MRGPAIELPGTVTVYCAKCTREQEFSGTSEGDAIRKAHRAGWTRDGERMICPKCPAAGPARRVAR